MDRGAESPARHRMKASSNLERGFSSRWLMARRCRSVGKFALGGILRCIGSATKRVATQRSILVPAIICLAACATKQRPEDAIRTALSYTELQWQPEARHIRHGKDAQGVVVHPRTPRLLLIPATSGVGGSPVSRRRAWHTSGAASIRRKVSSKVSEKGRRQAMLPTPTSSTTTTPSSAKKVLASTVPDSFRAAGGCRRRFPRRTCRPSAIPSHGMSSGSGTLFSRRVTCSCSPPATADM